MRNTYVCLAKGKDASVLMDTTLPTDEYFRNWKELFPKRVKRSLAQQTSVSALERLTRITFKFSCTEGAEGLLPWVREVDEIHSTLREREKEQTYANYKKHDP